MSRLLLGMRGTFTAMPGLDGTFPLFQKRSVDQNYLLGKASLIAKVQIEKGKILSVFNFLLR